MRYVCIYTVQAVAYDIKKALLNNLCILANYVTLHIQDQGPLTHSGYTF